MDDFMRRFEAEAAAFERECEARGLYHRGWRFWPPYCCGRCGAPVSAVQFAHGRGCCVLSSSRPRFHFADKRWFILGRVQLEDANDSAFIRPIFLSAALSKQFPRIEPRPLLPRPPLYPRRQPVQPPPRPYPKPRLGGGGGW